MQRFNRSKVQFTRHTAQPRFEIFQKFQPFQKSALHILEEIMGANCCNFGS